MLKHNNPKLLILHYRVHSQIPVRSFFVKAQFIVFNKLERLIKELKQLKIPTNELKIHIKNISST